MLIDSEETYKKLCEEYPLLQKGYLRRAIDKVPSAEPQIIRCKDCKHSYDDIGGTYCSYGVCVDCVVEEEFFCRDGKRREEE